MTHTDMMGRAAVPVPAMDVEALSHLPFHARMSVVTDYDMAISNWAIGRRCRQLHMWGWQLDYRRAMRAWDRYKRAVRAARMQVAA